MPVIYNQATDPRTAGQDWSDDSLKGLGLSLPAENRLHIATADLKQFIVAQFNPSELTRSIQVGAGQLEPIGWSHPVRQYSHTGAVKINLRLWFSALAAVKTGETSQYGERGAKYVAACVRWLESRCYAAAPGRAPTPLYLSWRNNLSVIVTLDAIATSYKMWTCENEVRIAECALQCTELRQNFRSSSNYAGGGLAMLDDAGAAEEFGMPLKMTGPTGGKINMVE